MMPQGTEAGIIKTSNYPRPNGVQPGGHYLLLNSPLKPLPLLPVKKKRINNIF
jgi:hypothetical protein